MTALADDADIFMSAPVSVVTATDIISDVRSLLAGESVFLTGSLVAEEAYGLSNAHADVDLFCPTMEMLISIGQRLLDAGYKFGPRFDRVWWRWRNYGVGSWHTNSLKLMSPAGVETNLVFKIMGKKPLTSLSQVIESFDFGLLGMGYDLELNVYRDLRSYLFPGQNPDGPLPLMPDKRANWRNGMFSQYNGLRESGRYAKYHRYGYDMSRVKDDMVTGYKAAWLYHSDHFDPDKQQLGQIYWAIAEHIEHDHIDDLLQAAKQIDYKDSLDQIMEALE